MRCAVAIIALCIAFISVNAQKSDSSAVNSQTSNIKLKAFSFFTDLPKDYSGFYKREFNKTQIKKYAAIAAGTGLLYAADQEILEGAQRLGTDAHINANDHMYAVFEVNIKTKSKELSFPLNVPAGTNSAMYFIGDGVTHFSISFGFWAYGKLAKDDRALRTGGQVLESMFASGIATQFLKHITGRESPFTTNVPRGVWRFFPNQKDYANHVPHYDAFPTGHLATAVGTVTVIAGNYPEWKMVKPIGYTLCGLLGFAMLNNGVHWASDYPLGIVLGYSFAKVITDRNKSDLKTEASSTSYKRKASAKPVILPAAFANGGMGAMALWLF